MPDTHESAAPGLRSVIRRTPAARARRIKVTYLITDLEIGGVPLHLYRLATRLPREQFDVTVISLADIGPVGQMLQDAGVPVEACHARSAMDVCVLGRLWRLLLADQPDILHALLFHANMAARVVGPLAGIPAKRIVCEIQTVEVERRWHLWLDNLTCRLCRCEIGNSPSVVEYLHRHAHVPLSRLHCEWGAVDVDAIAEAEPISRDELRWPVNGPIILWVGRLDPVKGFEEMLEAFKKVVRETKASLVLVGEGAYRSAIERQIKYHDLTRSVLMLGRRSDVPRLLKSSDLFLFCSRTEGLPNALLEAMAASLPIVATDVAGCRDLIVDEQTGLLSPVGEAERIAERILTLLNDHVLAGRLGDAAHRWVKAHVNLTDFADRWGRFYERFMFQYNGQL